MIKFDDTLGKFILDEANPKKFTVNDFASPEAIDALGELALKGDFNINDAEGFTPLCFAVLNNVEPLNLIYLAYDRDKEINVSPIINGCDVSYSLSDKKLKIGKEFEITHSSFPVIFPVSLNHNNNDSTVDSLEISKNGLSYSRTEDNNSEKIMSVSADGSKFTLSLNPDDSDDCSSVIIDGLSSLEVSHGTNYGKLSIDWPKFSVDVLGFSFVIDGSDVYICGTSVSDLVGLRSTRSISTDNLTKFLSISTDHLEVSFKYSNVNFNVTVGSGTFSVKANDTSLSLGNVNTISGVSVKPHIDDGQLKIETKIAGEDWREAAKLPSFSASDNYSLTVNDIDFSVKKSDSKFSFGASPSESQSVSFGVDLSSKEMSFGFNSDTLKVSTLSDSIKASLNNSSSFSVNNSGAASLSYNNHTVTTKVAKEGLSFSLDDSIKSTIGLSLAGLSFSLNTYKMALTTDGLSVNSMPIGSAYWGNSKPYKGKGAKRAKVCDKGKTPMQYAMMSGNTNAVDVLTGKSFETYALFKKKDYFYRAPYVEEDYPLFKDKEENFKYIRGTLSLPKANPSDIDNFVKVTPNNILSASSFTKPDLLQSTITTYDGPWYYPGIAHFEQDPELCKVFDQYGQTPIIMAARSQNYEMLEEICNKIYTSGGNGSVLEAASYTSKGTGDEYGVSALSIISDNKDKGALRILTKYYDDNSLLEYAFLNDQSLVESALTSHKEGEEPFDILHWVYNSENLFYKEYRTSEDGSSKSNVLVYLNDNYSNDLPEDSVIRYFFELIVNSYSSLSDSDKQRLFTEIVNKGCYKFVNSLIVNGVITNSDDALLDYEFNLIKSKHDSSTDTSILEAYISNGCYYLVKLLITRSIAGETEFVLTESEYELLAGTDDQIIIDFLLDLAYDESDNIAPEAIVQYSVITAHPGQTISLDASDSTDENNDDLTFLWSCDSSYSSYLVNADSVIAQFTVPEDITENTTYTFTVTVSDGHGGFDVASVTVNAEIDVTPENTNPVAVITSSATEGYSGQVIQLNAGSSYDPDEGDEIVSYSWSGDYLDCLSATNISNPQLTLPPVDTNTSISFTLTVTDYYGGVGTSSIIINVIPAEVQNFSPIVRVANSATNGYAAPGDYITLDASTSSDPDSDYPLSFEWSGDFADSLDPDKHSSVVNFIAPDVLENTTYTFTVTVTDSRGTYDSASTSFTVLSAHGSQNQPPTVEISSSSASGSPGQTISLNAIASDPDNDDLTFVWSCDNPAITIVNSTAPNASFTIPSNLSSSTTYTFTVVVSDGHDNIVERSITVSAVVPQNQLPEVTVENVSLEGRPGDTIQLRSTATDSDGTIVSYLWTCSNSSITIVNSTSQNAEFVIPSNAYEGITYTFTITVTDNRDGTASANTVVHVLPWDDSEIGYVAFTSNSFAIALIDDSDTMYNINKGRIDNIKEVWDTINETDGYYVPTIARSPRTDPDTGENTPYTYNLIYRNN